MEYSLDVSIYDVDKEMIEEYFFEYSTLKEALRKGKDFLKLAVQRIYYGDDYDYDFEEQYWYTEKEEIEEIIKDLELSYSFTIEESESKFFNTYRVLNNKDKLPLRKINHFNFDGELIKTEFKYETVGISTGFIDLDCAIKGLNDSSLIVIASRPAMGKTTLVFNIATHVAIKENIPVAIFNLEMSKEQCTNRILGSLAMVENSKLNQGKLDEKELQKVVKISEQLSKAEIYIEDMPSMYVQEIKEKCRELKFEKNIGLVVIDYLQLIKTNKKWTTREEEIAEISFELKKIAKELNIPIIVTSQLPKTPEKIFCIEEDYRPTYIDLRDSVSLIKDANVLLFLYREDYYNKDSKNKNIAEVIIAKNRYGKCNTIELIFCEKWLKFINLERSIKMYNETSNKINKQEQLNLSEKEQKYYIEPEEYFNYIIDVVAKYYNVEKKYIVEKIPRDIITDKLRMAKKIAMFLCYKLINIRSDEIAKMFKIDRCLFVYCNFDFEDYIKDKTDIKEDIKNIKKIIKQNEKFKVD